MKHLSEKSLTNVALFYLRKHSASRKGLVQMLERKVKLALRAKGGDPAAMKAIVDGVVAHMEKNGYVDDARFAESKTASVHRQGKSSRVIQMKLREKGIEPALAAKSAVSTPEQEFEAACMEVERFLTCGDPRFGFVEVTCETCAESRIVAFCCKSRGWCPSCTTRRALDTGVHLLENTKCPGALTTGCWTRRGASAGCEALR